MKNININFECFNKSFFKNQNIIYNIIDIRKELLEMRYFFLEDFYISKNYYNNNNIIGSDEEKIEFLQEKINFKKSIIIVEKIFNSYNFCEKYFFQYKKSFYELLKKNFILENFCLQRQNKVYLKSIENLRNNVYIKKNLLENHENIRNSIKELKNNLNDIEIIIEKICNCVCFTKKNISNIIYNIINNNNFFRDIDNFINLFKDNNNDELKNLQEKYIYLNKKNTIYIDMLNDVNFYVYYLNEIKNNGACIKIHYNDFLENVEKIKQVI